MWSIARSLRPSARAWGSSRAALGLHRGRGFAAAAKSKPAAPASVKLREDEVEEALFASFEKDVFPECPNPENLTLEGVGMDKATAMQILEAMFTTRIAHNVSRRAALEGKVHYTIGPGGHEGVAAVAASMRLDDPCLLHYRDTAFQLQRQLMAGDEDMLRNLMRSYTVSANDPASGGRHKILGSADLAIIPKTSTISSHAPRGVGLAASIPLAKRMDMDPKYPSDAIVLTSGGDAGINHATYRAAVNFLTYSHIGRRLPVPALLMVVDNEIGISVPTPKGWVETNLRSSGLGYFQADGSNVLDVYHKASQATANARKGKPTFLHITCPRLFNHAGSDAGQYQTPQTVADYIARDPLPMTVDLLRKQGVATAQEMKDLYTGIVKRAQDLLADACEEPKLDSVEAIQRALLPNKVPQPASVGPKIPTPTGKLAERPLIMKQHINKVLAETMAENSAAVILGEDVAEKGGNYGVTDGLKKKFGQLRVRDTLLDETSILGLGLGFSLNKLLPIVEICYLAYVHNAIDQLRGEGATLPFFSNGNYSNGMIVRISGGGLTEFGGHFHNENSLAPLLDIPGVIVMYASNGPDYVRLFRRARTLVEEEGRLVVVIEPLKAYAMRSFGAENTPWAFPYPDRDQEMEMDTVVAHGDGKDLCIATYGNGTWLSIEAARILKEEHGINATVLERPVLRGAGMALEEKIVDGGFGHVLFADECRQEGCPSAEVISNLVTKYHSGAKMGLVAAANTFLPLGEAAKVDGLYLSEHRIVREALAMLGRE